MGLETVTFICQTLAPENGDGVRNEGRKRFFYTNASANKRYNLILNWLLIFAYHPVNLFIILSKLFGYSIADKFSHQ